MFDDDNQPVLDGDGVPEYATDGDGHPVVSDIVVGGDDPFHAQTTEVAIVNGDGQGGTIVNDADTTARALIRPCRVDESPASILRSSIGV